MDFEAFTLLHQNALGLEVFDDEEWHMAPKPDEEHWILIVLVGGVVECWTNKFWPATCHRVRRPELHPRFSIVRFNAVDLDVEIGLLRKLLAPGIVPAFGPITERSLLDTKNAVAEADRESVRNEQTPPTPRVTQGRARSDPLCLEINAGVDLEQLRRGLRVLGIGRTMKRNNHELCCCYFAGHWHDCIKNTGFHLDNSRLPC